MTGSHSKPTACIVCRARHLKCDYRLPQCSRCSGSGTGCVYLESQRGQRGGRRRVNKDTSLREPVFFDNGTGQCDEEERLTASNLLIRTDDFSNFSSYNPLSMLVRAPILDFATENMIDLYYRYCHLSHPFIIPRKLYKENKAVLPDYLKKCMSFTACAHAKGDIDAAYQDARTVLDGDLPEDLFRVQALLLLTITSYACFQRDTGNQAVLLATQIAGKIGMAHENQNTQQHSIWRESWLRTWWQLYTIATLISLVSGTPCRLTIHHSQIVPGDDSAYEECRKELFSSSLGQLLERYHQKDEVYVSSFSYLIEATYLLNRVLDLQDNTIDVPHLDSKIIDTAITTFLLSIPSDKMQVQKVNGTIDEVMSCALMMVNLAGISLHFPQSAIAYGLDLTTVCGNGRAVVPAAARSCLDHHSARAVLFANSLCELIVGRTSLDTITPCFVCAVTFAATTHLSSLALQSPIDAARTKSRIQLALTALRAIGKTWPMGRMVHEQLAAYAGDVLKGSACDRTAAVQTQKESSTISPPEQADMVNEFVNLEDWVANSTDLPSAESFDYALETMARPYMDASI